MEQLLQRIVALIPSDIDLNSRSSEMEKFIAGNRNDLPEALNLLPYLVNSVYYLLADFYFKNRDFTKSVKYYVFDLANSPERFDSWAGLALSKASLLETKLNTCATVGIDEIIQQSEEVLLCFEQCLKIDNQTILVSLFSSSRTTRVRFMLKRFLVFNSAVDRVRKLRVRIAFILFAKLETIK